MDKSKSPKQVSKASTSGKVSAKGSKTSSRSKSKSSTRSSLGEDALSVLLNHMTLNDRRVANLNSKSSPKDEQIEHVKDITQLKLLNKTVKKQIDENAYFSKVTDAAKEGDKKRLRSARRKTVGFKAELIQRHRLNQKYVLDKLQRIIDGLEGTIFYRLYNDHIKGKPVSQQIELLDNPSDIPEMARYLRIEDGYIESNPFEMHILKPLLREIVAEKEMINGDVIDLGDPKIKFVVRKTVRGGVEIDAVEAYPLASFARALNRRMHRAGNAEAYEESARILEKNLKMPVDR